MSNQVNNTSKDSASFGTVCVQFLLDMNSTISLYYYTSEIGKGVS